MKIIIGHSRVDFDGLSSMYAAKLLYPDAIMVLIDTPSFEVQRFLSLYKDEISIFQLNEINLEEIKLVIVVDTNNKNRIGKVKELIERNVEFIVYDHHPIPKDCIKEFGSGIQRVGANTTLLVEEIMKKNIPLTSFDATVLGIGIYVDTGNFTYESTTQRDVKVIHYLFTKQINIEEVGKWIHHGLEENQQDLFSILIDKIEEFELQGIRIGITSFEMEEYIGGLNSITQEILELYDYQIVFSVVKMKKNIYICSRNNLEEIDLNSILKHFNGGGHKKAASAVIKEEIEITWVKEKIIDLIKDKMRHVLKAKDIMSYPVKSIHHNITMEEAYKIMLYYGHNGLPVVEENNLIGMITKRDVEKAVYHELGHAPVKGFMSKEVITVEPNASIYEIEKIIIEKNIGRLPVIDDNGVIGIITRTDLLYYSYFKSNAKNIIKKKQIKTVLEKLKCLPKEIQDIFIQMGSIADELGFKLYVAGGFVRDLFLGKENKDIDFIVQGSGIKLAQTYVQVYGGILKTHEKFKTSTIYLDSNLHVDIVTCRREYYSYAGSLPTVEEGSMYLDLFRRDFTINSMAILLNKESYGVLVDYFNGYIDLKQKKIKSLHKLSFIEDATRIFRALRFGKRLGFILEEETKELLIQAIHHSGFKTISQERILKELELILWEEKWIEILLAIQELNILENIYTGIQFKKEVIDSLNYIYENALMGNKKLDIFILILIMHQPEDIAYETLEKMKLSKGLKKNCIEIIQFLHTKSSIFDFYSDIWKVYDIFKNFNDHQLRALLAYYKDTNKKNVILKYIKEYKNMEINIKGEDILSLGVKEGKSVGKLLKLATQYKLENHAARKEEILFFLKNHIDIEKKEANDGD